MINHSHEYVGSIHLHTSASDGAMSYHEVASVASDAGLDFLIVTDHNVFTGGMDGWYGDVLLLVGEEVHDTKRIPAANHYLALDIERHVPGDGASAQEVIDAVNAQGGFGFLAHPFEHSPPFTREPELPWVDWSATGYTGLEIWNYMSEFKSYVRDVGRALLYIYFPQAPMRGPFQETLAKWDELLQHRKIAAMSGTDAHGNTYRFGPLRRQILPYEHCFRAVRNHIITTAHGDEPDFDCITEFWFEDDEGILALRETLDSDAGKIIRVDEETFMDRAKNIRLIVDERVSVI